MAKFEKPSKYPVSPLVKIERDQNAAAVLKGAAPMPMWLPGVRGGRHSEEGGKFMEYIRSKQPGYPEAGWRDITPYFGEQFPQSISAWRSSAAKNGYAIAIKPITQRHVCRADCTKPCFEPGFTYRGIFVCLNPPK